MKLIVISDIHANRLGLEAVLRAESDADRIVCAGDLTDYGPDPGGVIDLVRRSGIECVMGNHDRLLIDLYLSGRWKEFKKGEQLWRSVNCRRVTPEQVDFLKQLPERAEFEADGLHYLVTHSSGNGYHLPADAAEFDAAAVPGENRRVIFGHTHVPKITRIDAGRVWYNPGSVSYGGGKRKRGENAHYLALEDGEPFLRRAGYDNTLLLESVLELENDLTDFEFNVAKGFFDY